MSHNNKHTTLNFIRVSMNCDFCPRRYDFYPKKCPGGRCFCPKNCPRCYSFVQKNVREGLFLCPNALIFVRKRLNFVREFWSFVREFVRVLLNYSSFN